MQRLSMSPKHITSLPPPFESRNSLRTLDDCMCVVPAAIFCGNQYLRPKLDFSEFLRLDLLTHRLDKIYRHLWLAGEPTAARPLHRQRLLRREIVLTESPEEHMVEDRAVIFIKPLPEYLLSFEFWTLHLNLDRNLHQSACGLILSYVWMVAYRNDLRIAQEAHLLPETLTWAAWKDFADDFIDHVGASTALHVSKRYNYGELWLRHLNVIYKFSPSVFSLENLQHDFLRAPMWYGFFLERNVTRLFAIFAFLSLILSAMQVGQATPALQNSTHFSRASYGFSVATIFLVLLSILAVVLAWTAPRGLRALNRWGRKQLLNINQ